ncbi:S8 family serine peptidase [Christiangramia sabulilitoris]|uniref:S8 family serine peptidase n=1 Tax=Christiangramia sabulilitoris TaxID=2583991 RepID=A0A550I2Q9_9FLAO|nr:S8 family serine peptidase [Christiangramia sabulilitoris]TRO65272.1 S8 family serine peptidase [Christiangramia sabulilitoris]
MKKFFLLILFVSLNINAQQEHAWVFFTNKTNVQEALEDPYSILSPRAVERKSLRGTPIDERDVPVNENYIAQIKNQEGISVKAKSKWFNCVHVIGSLEQISNLSSLNFVSKIEFASNELENRASLQQLEKVDKLEANVEFTYGPAGNQVKMLNTDYLHQNDLTGNGIIIAVMDAGFPNVNNLQAFSRLRTQGKLLGGYDFPGRSSNFSNTDLDGHGTVVLATMAGFLEDEYTGTAPDASYYLFRTEIAPTETPVEESYWVEAAERADSLGVDIINTSLGYTTFDEEKYDYSPQDMDGKTAFISRGASVATEKGMLVVTSAGNRGDRENFNIIGAPGDANVLTIGAVDKDGEYAFFSSTGPSADGRTKPDLAAQGLEIITIDEFGNLVVASGTSFASPILAGSAASLWQANPEWTNLELMQILRESGSLYENPNSMLGYGIPDLSTAYQSTGSENFTPGDFIFSPNPVKNILNFVSPEDLAFDITVFDTLGQKILHQKNTKDKIDLTGFSSGIYIVMFEQNSSKKSFLIIKE